MTYREQLNKVNELGISICDLEVANELDKDLSQSRNDDDRRNCLLYQRFGKRRRQNRRRNSRNG